MSTTFDGATPVFLVSDIAATMRWYSTHLEFDVYGQTEFVIRDPNGYALVFAEGDRD